MNFSGHTILFMGKLFPKNHYIPIVFVLLNPVAPIPGVTMPGTTKITADTLTAGTRDPGYVDIHVNATTRWKDVPEAVWSYTLGGYQVLKKWLSYREATLLKRPLTGEEAQSFTHHTRRIAALIEMQDALDAHYRASSISGPP